MSLSSVCVLFMTWLPASYCFGRATPFKWLSVQIYYSLLRTHQEFMALVCHCKNWSSYGVFGVWWKEKGVRWPDHTNAPTRDRDRDRHAVFHLGSLCHRLWS